MDFSYKFSKIFNCRTSSSGQFSFPRFDGKDKLLGHSEHQSVAPSEAHVTGIT